MSDGILDSFSKRDLLAAIEKMYSKLTLDLAPSDASPAGPPASASQPLSADKKKDNRIRFEPITGAASNQKPRGHATCILARYKTSDCIGDLILTFADQNSPTSRFTVAVSESHIQAMIPPAGSANKYDEIAGQLWQRIEEFLCFSSLKELTDQEIRL
jgi:hypothetical protein